MAICTVSAAGGNWSATTAWQAGVVPTAADDVVATALSGALTIDTTAVARSVDFTNLNTLGSLTCSANQSLAIGTSTSSGTLALFFPTGLTVTCAASFTFSFVSSVAATTLTADFAGKTIGHVTLNRATTGSLQLTGHGFLQTSASIVTLTQGTLDTNGQTCSWGSFVATTGNTIGLTLGASAITILLASGTPWNASGGAWTLSAGTSSITFTAGSITVVFGNKTYYDVSFPSWSGTAINLGGPSTTVTFHNLTCSSATASPSLIAQIDASSTWTVNGTLTLTGASATLCARVLTNRRGKIAISAAATSLTNVILEDITASGAAAWTGTRVGDGGFNSGITFDGARSLFWVGGTGNFNDTAHWSTSSGGASGAAVPLPQDSITFDANSFSGAGQTVTFKSTMPWVGDFDCSAVTHSPTFAQDSAQSLVFYGNVKLASSAFMTWIAVNGTSQWVLAGRVAATVYSVTSNGNAWPGQGRLGARSATYKLLDAFNNTNTAGLNWLIFSGELQTNGQTVTTEGIDTITSVGPWNRLLTLAASTINLTGTGASTIWNMGTTNVTISASTSVIVVQNASANQRTFVLGTSVTYGTITYTVAASTGALVLNGTTITIAVALNFSDVTNARTLTFQSSQTFTFNSGAGFNVNGTAGKLMSITASTAGTAANLVLAGGAGEVLCSYLSIKDSHASGGNWQAVNSTSVSGNTGWLFGAYLSASGAATATKSTDPTLLQIGGLAASGAASTSGSAWLWLQARIIQQRDLYLYENDTLLLAIAMRDLYLYENDTNDPLFPWLLKLYPPRQVIGGIVDFYGDGFGATAGTYAGEVDISDVFGAPLAFVISSWSSRSPGLWPCNSGAALAPAIRATVPVGAVSNSVLEKETT